MKSTLSQTMTECPECGSPELRWDSMPRKLTTIADGQLTMRDVETIFFLGCEECSETVVSEVGPDEVAKYLTSSGFFPDMARMDRR